MSAVPGTPPSAPAPQLELAFAPDAGGVTRVARRRVCYPYTFLKPFWFGDRPPGLATVMLQSASGGLFGGETLTQTVSLARGAAVHLTTQAAAIVHAMRGQPPARQHVRLVAGPGAHLEYVCEPLLLFPDAGLEQTFEVELDPTACVVYADGFVQHDPGTDDRPFAHYRSDLGVRVAEGRLLLLDRMEIAGAEFAAAMRTARGAWRACGICLVAAPALGARHAAIAGLLNAALAALEDPNVYAAAVVAPNDSGVVCRIAAADGAALRAALEACWRTARLALSGQPPPRRRK